MIGGVDVLNNPLYITGDSVNTAVTCGDGTIITSVKSDDESVVKAVYSDGVLSVSKISPGKTYVIINTATGNEYKIEVINNATAPTISVTASGEGGIKWNSTYGAIKYDIYRADNKNGIYSKLGTVTGLSYADTTSTYGKTYYYKVVSVAKNSYYSSDYSNVASYKRIPATPVIKSVTKSNGRYRVAISSSTKCDGYVVYVGSSKNPTSVSAITDSTNATITIGGSSCYIRVRGYVVVDGNNVYSKYSDNYVYTVSSGELTNTNKVTVGRTKVKKATRSGKKIKLKLKKVSGAKGYRIKYSTSKKFKKAKIKTIKKTSATLKKIKTTKAYYIKARAYKVVNGKKVWGNWSKVKKVKVKK